MHSVTDPLDPNRVPKPLSGPFETERERTINALKKAFEQGTLTLEEYDERVELASSASTGVELEVLVHDLPASAPATLSSGLGPGGTDTIATVFGNHERHGQWSIAPALKVRAIFGEVRLDMGQAVWPTEDVSITCSPIFGTVVLRVPPDVNVQIKGRAIFGDIKNRTVAFSGPKTRTLIVYGRPIFGSVKIETVYPKGVGRA
jgi:hypothetical protein